MSIRGQAYPLSHSLGPLLFLFSFHTLGIYLAIFSLVIHLQVKYPSAATYVCVLGWLLRAAACLLTKPSPELWLVLKPYAGNVNGLTEA